jgi:imidazolonepropionase-like amidohydrolase
VHVNSAVTQKPPGRWVRLAAGLTLADLLTATSVSLAAAQSDGIVFANVTLIDGTGDMPRRGIAVVVSGDRISSIGRTDEVRVSPGSITVDGRGKYLIPGLWDMHVHLGAYDDGRRLLPRLVGYGITGVRDRSSRLDLCGAIAGDRLWTKRLQMFSDLLNRGVRVLAGSDLPAAAGVRHCTMSWSSSYALA